MILFSALARSAGEGDHAKHGGGGMGMRPAVRPTPLPPLLRRAVPLPRFAGQDEGDGVRQRVNMLQLGQSSFLIRARTILE
jgi:hypothetical protein